MMAVSCGKTTYDSTNTWLCITKLNCYILQLNSCFIRCYQWHFNLEFFLCFNIFTVITVGYTETAVNISERAGFAQLCVGILEPEASVTIDNSVSFYLLVNRSDNTTGWCTFTIHSCSMYCAPGVCHFMHTLSS